MHIKGVGVSGVGCVSSGLQLMPHLRRGAFSAEDSKKRPASFGLQPIACLFPRGHGYDDLWNEILTAPTAPYERFFIGFDECSYVFLET